jgi:hypothetical protein
MRLFHVWKLLLQVFHLFLLLLYEGIAHRNIGVSQERLIKVNKFLLLV